MTLSIDHHGMSHASVARRYWKLIAATLMLLGVENVFTVLEPWLLGRAIDGLIARDYTNLCVLIGASLAALGVGVARRLYDTRAYGRIYRETASAMVEQESAAEKPVSQIVARASFVQEFADFFEQMVPAALVSALTLVGAVVMMAVLSPLLCAATIAVAALIAGIFLLSRQRMMALNTHLNDEMERQVEVLTQRNRATTITHFSSIVRWRIALSDLEARNFGGVFFLTITLTAVAAVIMIVVEEKSEGQIFAALTYVLQFSEALVILPYTYQQYVRTSEISARLAPPGAEHTTLG